MGEFTGEAQRTSAYEEFQLLVISTTTIYDGDAFYFVVCKHSLFCLSLTLI